MHSFRFADINNNNNNDDAAAVADDVYFFVPKSQPIKIGKSFIEIVYKNIDGFLSDFIKRFIILGVCLLTVGPRAHVCPTIHWLMEFTMVYGQDMIVIHGDLLTVSFVDVV